MKHAPLYVKRIALCAALFITPPLAVAQEPDAAKQQKPQQASIEGSWLGALKVQATELKVALHIQRGDDGAYKATFDSITQGAKGIAVDSIQRDADQIIAKLPAIGASYEANLVVDEGGARKLDGTWKQGGRTLELDLEPATAEAAAQAAPKRPQNPDPATVPYRSEEVTFGHDPSGDLDATFRVGTRDAGVTIAGTLTLPEGPGPFPAAVMISGSGPQDRDESLLGHKPFWVIADHLTRRGIAILRCDDRGVGKSTGDFGAATSQDFATDARAALRYLATRSEIDPGRLGLIGHSEGGLIAPMVASGPDRDALQFAVLIAPPAVNIRDIIVHQSRLMAAAEGASDDDLALNEELTGKALTAVAKHADSDRRQKALQTIVEAFWPKLPDEDRKQLGDDPKTLLRQLRSLNTPWMHWLLAYDPVPALKETRCHVLAMFGGKDLQVDPAQNRPPLEKALADCPKPATVITLAGHNHLFQHTETGKSSEYGELEETFSVEALTVMANWLMKVTSDK
ncbi:MAG: alpha/beta hydrolase family protein [Planctomycetota bacterium]